MERDETTRRNLHGRKDKMTVVQERTGEMGKKGGVGGHVKAGGADGNIKALETSRGAISVQIETQEFRSRCEI